MQSPQDAPTNPPGTSIDRHVRTISVADNGIATVKTELTNVQLEKEMPLGSPSPGFSGIHFDPVCQVTGRDAPKQTVAVSREGEDDSPRFVANTERRVEIETMTWKYVFANGFALDQADVLMGRYPGRKALNLDGRDGSTDGFAYCVETPTKELVLTLELPPSSQIVEPKVVVQRSCVCNPGVQWRPDAIEPGTKFTDLHSNRISLTVAYPHVGNRYGVKYRLGPRRAAISQPHLECIDKAVKECRRSPPGISYALSHALTDAIGRVLDENLTLKEGEHLDFWVAHLWDSRRLQLVACFGRYAPDYWTSMFASGEGIAGHAFRMRQAAVYNLPTLTGPDQPGYLYLLYRRGGAVPAERDVSGGHRWIIELPILLDDGVAVGTIGFAESLADEALPEARRGLGRMAREIAFNPRRAAGHRRTLSRITRDVSREFWSVLASRGDELAKEIHRTWMRRRPRR